MISRTLVSSKTKQSKKVFTLQLNQEALIDNRSILGKNWKVIIYSSSFTARHSLCHYMVNLKKLKG